MPNISAVALFCFGMTVISTGYILVEILGGEKYRFRKALDRNNNNMVDRFIHYILWGVVINFIFICFYQFTGNLEILVNFFNSNIKIGEAFNVNNETKLNIGMICFSVWHSIVVNMLTIIIYKMTAIIESIESIDSKIIALSEKSKIGLMIYWIWLNFAYTIFGLSTIILFPALADIHQRYYATMIAICEVYFIYKIRFKK